MLTAAAENQNRIGRCHGERSGPAAINADCCSTEARLRHNNDISQYNEYTLVLRYNILFSRVAEEEIRDVEEALKDADRFLWNVKFDQVLNSIN